MIKYMKNTLIIFVITWEMKAYKTYLFKPSTISLVSLAITSSSLVGIM